MHAIVHIGTEKTGSTAIQEFLRLNQEQLANQGFVTLPLLRKSNHRKLATFCMSEDRDDDATRMLGITGVSERRAWKTAFAKQFDDELAEVDPSSTVIISSEHFHSRLIRDSEVAELRAFLSKRFDSVYVIVYLRRQDKVAVSLYSTLCKAGRIRNEIIHPGIPKESPYFNYLRLINLWASHFGRLNVKIRMFDQLSSAGGSLLQDFCTHVDIAWSESFELPGKMNAHLSAKSQRILIGINRAFPTFVNDRPIPVSIRLRRMLIRELEERYEGQPLMPNRDEAVSFYNKFARSNRKLARKYLGCRDVFSNDFSMYPEETQEPVINETDVVFVLGLIAKFCRAEGGE